MPLVTAGLHSFLYFFVYLKTAEPVIGGLLVFVLGIPIVGLHVLVWAAARFANGAWAALAALLANGLCALAGVLWPTPVPGTGPEAGWAVNALVFIAIGMATNAVLIGYVRFARRRFAAPKRDLDR